MLLLLLLPPAGWCPSVVSSLGGGGPAALDRRPLLSQAASQGNVTLLSKLLNQPDPTANTTTSTSTSVNTSSTTAVGNKPDHLDPTHHNLNQTSALFAAAQNGHTGNHKSGFWLPSLAGVALPSPSVNIPFN